MALRLRSLKKSKKTVRKLFVYYFFSYFLTILSDIKFTFSSNESSKGIQ